MSRMSSVLRSAWNGNVIADICITPLGTPTVSVSYEVAKIENILRRFPLKTRLHAYGTNIEGSWDDISNAIKAIHTEMHDAGIVRLSCNMRWGTRTDKDQTLEDKVNKVESILRQNQ
jgi:uncharacterized protein (TIGR00106 family)